MPNQGYTVDQTAVWFDMAADLSVAASAIKREMTTGHVHIDPPLSPEQLKQRQAILGIAHAVIDSARKRALETFHQLQHSETCEKTLPAGL
jgi:hypothetical protein